MEVSIRQMFYFSVHNNTLYYKTRFLFSSYEGSQSPKKKFISKTWGLTKNKLRHNLQLKTDSVKDFITDISSKVLKIYWKNTQLRFKFPMKFLVEAWRFTKTDSGTDSLTIYSKTFMFIRMVSRFAKGRLYHRLCHYHLQ